MYNGNYAQKSAPIKKSLYQRMTINGDVAKSWLRIHDEAKRNKVKMGDGDYCMGVCMGG